MLTDPDVVAFELPRVGRMRRQNFHVIDRAMVKAPTRRAGQEPARPPRRLAGKLVALIDGAGALRAVASGRDRLLFESPPILFFADVPSARLKQRPANKMRRELVAIGARACVLRAGPKLTTLMLWPSSEAMITQFIEEAGPEHAPHPEFDADPVAPKQPAKPGAANAARLGAREARLLRQIAVLQGQVDALTRAQSAVGAMQQLGLDDARLKSMLKLLHPDRHGNSEAANEAAKWLNSMRDLLKGAG